MTITEWLLFVAVIDGPLIALGFYIWKGMWKRNDRKIK